MAVFRDFSATFGNFSVSLWCNLECVKKIEVNILFQYKVMAVFSDSGHFGDFQSFLVTCSYR